jgi:hypothetical protein
MSSSLQRRPMTFPWPCKYHLDTASSSSSRNTDSFISTTWKRESAST